MDRRQYLGATGVVTGTLVAGCLGGIAGGNTGTLATKVSDQPGDIDDFATLEVAISGIRVKPTDGELEELDADSTVDLTKLVGEATALVEETALSTGSYEYLQLEAEATTAELKDGGSATVEVPGEAPLKFEKEFEIRSNRTTTFVADFTPVKAGKTGRYVLKPVADEVQVSYEGESPSPTA